MRENDWQHGDQQRTTCRSGRKGAAGGRCWTRRRDAGVLERKGGHLAKDFSGKKQGRLQLSLAAQQGEVGTPSTCSHAEGAGGPVLRPGEGSANTVATQLTPPGTELGCENCSLVSKPFQSRQTVDSCSQPRARFPRCTTRRPRSALPTRHSLRQHLADHWQTAAGQSVSTPTNMEAATAAGPIFSHKVLRHTGRQTVPKNDRGPCVNLNSRRQWRVGAGCGPTQLAVPPANGELAIGRQSWPTTGQGHRSQANHGPHHRSQRRGSRGRPPVEPFSLPVCCARTARRPCVMVLGTALKFAGCQRDAPASLRPGRRNFVTLHIGRC